MAQTVTIKGYSNTKTTIKVPQVAAKKFEGSVTFLREGTGTPKYTGQFGFDWMDLTTQQYHKAAGKRKYNKILKKFEFDATTTASEFSKLEKEYDVINIFGYNNGINTNYYTPWYSAFKNSKNLLNVEFKIKTSINGVIKLEATDTNILLSKTKISTKNIKPGVFNENIEFSFKSSISKHAKVEAKFYDDAKKHPNGVLIGAINIYKNDIEYNMNLKFIKVAIKGAIKVEGEKEKIVLDPITKKYSNYNKEIKSLDLEIKTTIPNKIKNLNVELKKVIADPPASYNIFATTQSDINEDIKALNDELKKRTKELNEVKRLYALAKKIDSVQNANLNSSESKVKNKKQLLENIFGQALVNYNNTGTDSLVIEASDYKEIFDFTDDIEIYLHTNPYGVKDYKIRYTEGSAYDTGEFKETTMASYNNYKDNENYIFMMPLNMHSNNKKNSNLLGSAESVSHEGYRAIMLPMANADTIVHEVGHVFNLFHTFNNKHINFCRGTIENIMDYSDFDASHPSISANPIRNKTTFFKWQWDTIKKDPHIKKINV